jgi:hypothetical protein
LLNEALRELEDIKVPAGMEDFHRELMALFRGNLLTYEELAAALEPDEEQSEVEHEGSGEVESTEQSHEEEVPQGEEEPAEGTGH